MAFKINNKDLVIGIPQVEDKGKYVYVSITDSVYDPTTKQRTEQTVTATANGRTADFLKKVAPEALVAMSTKQNGSYTNVDEISAYSGLFTEELEKGTWGVLFGEIKTSTNGKPYIPVRTYDRETGENATTLVWIHKTKKVEKVWDKLIQAGRKVALTGFVSVNVDGDNIFTGMNVCGIETFKN